MVGGKSMGGFLSLTLRVLVNLESLNMAESVGNVTRHRKAPVVVKAEDGGYRMVYVPVVSGMSLAHHYQRHLAAAAASMGLPVTKMSLLGYFMKFANNDIINQYYNEIAEYIKETYNEINKIKDKLRKAKKDEIKLLYRELSKKVCSIEEKIVKDCIVADIGGFLYTDGGVKRTSRFSFTYLAPALEALEKGAAGVLPQLHTRYTPGAKEGEQALYYVDTGSALYTLTYTLEASKIARLETCPALGVDREDLGPGERIRRFEAAYKALTAMLGNMAFGAKRSRSQPHWVIDSIIVVSGVGLTPFIPTPGHYSEYMQDTIRRLETQAKVGVVRDYTVHYYIREGSATLKPDNGSEAKSLEEAITRAAEWLKSRLGEA